jgi:hypothetical protein
MPVSVSVSVCAGCAGYDLMFVRTVAPFVSPSRAIWEGNLIEASRTWRERGLRGALPKCNCAREPDGELSPDQWREWLVDNPGGAFASDTTLWEPPSKPISAPAPAEESTATADMGQLGTTPKPYLCLYFSQGVSPEELQNLLFFLMFGVEENNPDIDYLLIFVGVESEMVELPMDVTARLNVVLTFANVRTLNIANPTSEYCAFGHGLSRLGGVDAVLTNYQYMLFVSDSVRGPFMPAYLSFAKSRRLQSWYAQFVSRMQFQAGAPEVHLVGSYLSSELHTHVQSMVYAMDRVGLATARDVFRCYNGDDSLWQSEIGLAGRMLKAGHNVASMSAVFDGANFCVPGPPANNKVNPILGFYDSTQLAMDGIFVATSGYILATRRLDGDYFPRINAMTDWYFGAHEVRK